MTILIVFGMCSTGFADVTPVGDRTPQVRDAIVAAVPGVNSAADVTEAHLAAITRLSLSSRSIASLKVGDFDGLTSLTYLYLNGNDLSSLSAGIFEGLTSLTYLNLSGNDLSNLSAGIFEGLTSLTYLDLHSNDLSNLPAGIFEGLTSLTVLNLNGNDLSNLLAGIFEGLTSLTYLNLESNDLSNLPAGIFEGLTSLTVLNLYGNDLSSLSAGIFEGLTSLTYLNLYDNTADPLPLTVSLEKVSENQFKAVAPIGAPFDFVLPISVTNGSISGGATSITIPAGSVESDILTVTRTPDTTGAVTVNIGTLPSLPSNHSGYALAKSTGLPLSYPLPEVHSLVGIRTPQVRDAIVAAVPDVNSAADVTEAHLAAITGLSLNSRSIASLKVGDFDGLTSLTYLNLYGNDLSNLPAGIFEGLTSLAVLNLHSNDLSNLSAGIFDGLTSLTSLYLNGNDLSNLPAGIFEGLTSLAVLNLYGTDLSNLPAGIFEGLTSLAVLNLYGTDLSNLPAGIFDGLTSLTHLSLGGNDLSNLPAGIFDGLTSLTYLDLHSNDLSNLSAGIFEGLTSLRYLYLNDNTVDPLPLTVSFEKVSENQFKAVAPIGAPFDFVLPISVTNGSFSGGTTTVTIPAGNVESETLTVTRTPDTTGAVTVNIGTLPSLPSNHFGYALAKSADLPLEVISAPSNSAPVFTDGTSTTRTIAENTASGINIGTPVSATDVNNDTLTYSLSGTDAAVFSIDNNTGQLRTKSALDYETKQTYTVIVTVSDGSLTNAITITINVTDIPEVILTARFEALPESHDGSTFRFELHFSEEIKISYRNVRDDVLNVTAGTVKAVRRLQQGSNRGWEITIEPESNAEVSIVLLPTEDCDAIGAVCTTDRRPLSSELRVIVPGPSIPENPETVSPISNHTPQVRDAIVAALPGVNSANDVTEAHLATITSLNLRNKGISTLNAGDFDGLTALTELQLQGNQLRTLPADVFSELSSLKMLYLGNNKLTSLSPEVFSGLTAVTDLHIHNNQLETLPQNLFSRMSSLAQINIHSNRLTSIHEDAFSGLPSLTQLFLRNNRLTSLPQDVFSGLSKLQYLYLDGNQLTDLPTDVFSGLSSLIQLFLNGNQLSTLPAEVFRGLTGLTRLRLQANSVSPMPLTVSLEKVGLNQFKATAPAGAPFAIVLPVSVANGSISGGATTLTIPQGGVESTSRTVTRTVGTTAAVTVDIGTVPGLPTRHQGYELAKSADLPLEVISAPSNSAPVFTDGTSTTHTIAENTAAGINIGSPVAATDADNDSLTYSLSGTDASAFSIVSTTGQLQTNAALDYEAKNSYTVTVTVFDGSSTDTITVTINVTDANDAPTFTDDTSTTRSVAEDTASGNNIGTAVAATDADNNTLTYTLGGTDAASFGINSTNGQLRTSAALDYESKSSYSVTVSVSDGNGGSDSISVTINVTNVTNANEAPVFSDGSSTSRSIAENTASGQNIGSAVSATDPDSGTTLTYTLGGTDAASFGIVSSSGQLQTKAALDYETKTSYSVTVSVSDGNGGTDSITVTINVTDVPDTPDPPVSERTQQVQDAIVAAVPGVSSAGDVTATHLAAIASLRLDNEGITTLQEGDFDGLTALTTLDLGYNSISDISTLQNLTNLTYLSLSSNSISDISALEDLTNLTSLWLAGNSISDYGPLRRLIAAIEAAGRSLWLDITIPPLPLSERTQQVRDAIVAAVPGVSSAGDVTATHLAAITSLDLNNKGITTLQEGDFDGLTALTTLDLGYNSISDISTLQNLTNLTSLSLDDNSISDISTLQNLTNLTSLSLSSNSISDISPLEDLTNLTWLNLSDNSISDISPLEDLTNLTALFLSDNSISDISPLEDLTNLTWLWLAGNSISDYAPLRRLIAAIEAAGRSLWLDITIPPLPLSERTQQVRDAIVAAVPGVSSAGDVTATHLAAITSLRLDNKGITTLQTGDFDGLTGLTYLNLRDNSISDISALEDLTNLTWLSLSSNSISDISTLENLTNLTTLGLTGNSISDISTLQNLTNLITLYLGDNSISDISTLEDLTNLIKLYLPSNSISDISPLEDLTNLGRLKLAGNSISDYAPLRRLIAAIEAAGGSLTLDIAIPEEDDNRAPSTQATPIQTELLPNFPNPFNPETWIPYHLTKASDVQITIYNARGVVVRELSLGHQVAGYYTSKNRAAYWDGKNEFGEKVAAGVYFYQLQANNMSLLRKMVILK